MLNKCAATLVGVINAGKNKSKGITKGALNSQVFIKRGININKVITLDRNHMEN